MTSIAVVVLDTLRKDVFDEYFSYLPGKSFERAYSTANWTAPAHASLFTGQYSSEVGVDAKSSYFDCEERALAETLSDAGYETRALSANHNVSSRKQFDRGFREFVNPSELKNPTSSLLDWQEFLFETDASGVELYLRALRECVFGDHDTIASIKCGLGHKLNQPWMVKSIDDDGASAVLEGVREMDFGRDEFLFLNLMETHTPYDPPDEYNTLNESVSVSLRDTFEGVENPEIVERAYEDAARYLSRVYQDIFEELTRSFDYIVTLSDHGEMLGEHGFWNHTYGLYPEVTRIPLVITDVADPTDSVCSDPVSLVDVHRTVLDLAGVPGESRGQSLCGDIEPRDRLAEYRGLLSVAKDRLRNAGVDGSEIEKYDEEFPALVGKDGYYAIDQSDEIYVESGNASPGDGVDETELHRRIDTLYERFDVRETQEDGDELTAEARSRLEDLGYV